MLRKFLVGDVNASHPGEARTCLSKAHLARLGSWVTHAAGTSNLRQHAVVVLVQATRRSTLPWDVVLLREHASPCVCHAWLVCVDVETALDDVLGRLVVGGELLSFEQLHARAALWIGKRLSHCADHQRAVSLEANATVLALSELSKSVSLQAQVILLVHVARHLLHAWPTTLWVDVLSVLHLTSFAYCLLLIPTTDGLVL